MLAARKFANALFLLVAWFVLAPVGVFAGEVHKVGPDLYAYISSNDSSANSTFLITNTGILVVDTGLNEIEGRKLLAEIRRISAAPVRWIVNTHYHPDHRGGNSVFGADAKVISSSYTRAHVLIAPREPGANQAGGRQFPGEEGRGLRAKSHNKVASHVVRGAIPRRNLLSRPGAHVG